MKKLIPIGFGVLIILWLSILTFVFVSHKNQISNQIDILRKSEVDNPDAEMIKLKAQVQQIVDYNDDFLSTILWSLGFSSTFLLVFLGLIGYLTNHRYEQDKESLENRIQSFSKDIESSTQAELSEFKVETQKLVLEKSDKLKTELKKISNESAQSISSPLESQIKELNRDLLLLEREFLKIEAKHYEETGMYGNALNNHFEIAEIGFKVKYQWIVSQALEEIIRLLDIPSTFRNAEDVRKVTIFLQKLPPEYEALVNRITSKM